MVDTELHYYKKRANVQDYSKAPLGRIPLREVKSIDKAEDNLGVPTTTGYVFILATITREYVLLAQNEGEMSYWIGGIRQKLREISEPTAYEAIIKGLKEQISIVVTEAKIKDQETQRLRNRICSLEQDNEQLRRKKTISPRTISVDELIRVNELNNSVDKSSSNTNKVELNSFNDLKENLLALNQRINTTLKSIDNIEINVKSQTGSKTSEIIRGSIESNSQRGITIDSDSLLLLRTSQLAEVLEELKKRDEQLIEKDHSISILTQHKKSLQDEQQIFMTLIELVDQISPPSNSSSKESTNGTKPVIAQLDIDSLRKNIASKIEDNDSLEKNLGVYDLEDFEPDERLSIRFAKAAAQQQEDDSILQSFTDTSPIMMREEINLSLHIPDKVIKKK